MTLLHRSCSATAQNDSKAGWPQPELAISRRHHTHHLQAVRVCHRFSRHRVPLFPRPRVILSVVFYQLRLPHWLGQSFGLPPVARKHLPRWLQSRLDTSVGEMLWDSICQWYRWAGIWPSRRAAWHRTSCVRWHKCRDTLLVENEQSDLRQKRVQHASHRPRPQSASKVDDTLCFF